MVVEEMDFEVDSCSRTPRGGIIIVAKELHSNKMYKLHFTKSDFDWFSGAGSK